MAKTKLNSKSFFSIVVLSVAVLGTMLFTFSAQQKTNTQSDATGNNYGSLSNCSSNYGRSGGIQLYDVVLSQIDKNTNTRIMCVRMQSKQESSTQPDPNLGNIQSGSKYYDIWNFNNQTRSFKLRANKFCYIRAEFYGKPTYGNLLYKSPYVGGTTVDRAIERPIDLPSDVRDKATSLILYTVCDLSKY